MTCSDWVKLDTLFSDHPKIRAAGPFAALLQIAAICYCGRHLTDGFISHIAVRGLVRQTFTPWYDAAGILCQPEMRIGDTTYSPDDLDWGETMVHMRLWDHAPGGFVVHDYHRHQRSREVAVAQRESGRRGGVESAKARARQPSKSLEGKSKAPLEKPATEVEVEVERDQREIPASGDAAPKADAKKAHLRYGEAYAKGVERAGGIVLSAPTSKRDLVALATTYAKGATGDALLAWFESTGFEYRSAIDAKDAKYQSGFSPEYCLKWLAAGRPGAKSHQPVRPSVSGADVLEALRLHREA